MVWGVNNERKAVAFIFAEMSSPWKAIRLFDFLQTAVMEVRDPAVQDGWLDGGPLDPIQLPVDHVVFASVEGQRKKCSAATMGGRCAAWNELLRGAAADAWDVFLAYTPGFGANFAKPAMCFTLAVGQKVECTPPLLVADKKLAKKVSPPKVPRTPLVLGLMTGEEHWHSNSKDGEQKRRLEQMRRFAVLEIDTVVYFLSFEQLRCKHDPSVVSSANVRDCVRKAFEAGLERTPAQPT
eukprot:6209532-Pleurochrysis_carterae.AAC.1